MFSVKGHIVTSFQKREESCFLSAAMFLMKSPHLWSDSLLSVCYGCLKQSSPDRLHLSILVSWEAPQNAAPGDSNVMGLEWD